jgi:hypothetical protein
MLINYVLVLLFRTLQLSSDMAMELLHFRRKVLLSCTSDITLFQVSQLRYSSGLHSLLYLEWSLSSARVW